MQIEFIGTAIKRRRKELRITQAQLAEGICEPITISRLENGHQLPGQHKLMAILERLDLPTEQYYAIISKRELEISDLQRRIVSGNMDFEGAAQEKRKQIRQDVLELHRKLEQKMEPNDKISRQLILRSQAILGTEDGPYPLEVQRKLFLDAIQLTSPEFDLQHISQGIYTGLEIKIINSLAVLYIQEKKHRLALQILEPLYEYILSNFQNLPAERSHLLLIMFNYSLELLTTGQYQAALDIAQQGYQISLDTGLYRSIPVFLANIAESLFFLGRTEESRAFYYKAYYTLTATNDNYSAEFVRKDALNYLGIQLEY